MFRIALRTCTRRADSFEQFYTDLYKLLFYVKSSKKLFVDGSKDACQKEKRIFLDKIVSTEDGVLTDFCTIMECLETMTV